MTQNFHFFGIFNVKVLRWDSRKSLSEPSRLYWGLQKFYISHHQIVNMSKRWDTYSCSEVISKFLRLIRCLKLRWENFTIKHNKKGSISKYFMLSKLDKNSVLWTNLSADGYIASNKISTCQKWKGNSKMFNMAISYVVGRVHYWSYLRIELHFANPIYYRWFSQTKGISGTPTELRRW